MKSKDLIPSPEATGNSGGNYEQHVGAACLSILLIGGVAPFSADAVLTWVYLQARHLGFQTDDLLLIAESLLVAKHRIAIQAKRTFSLAASDEECVKTLRAAWDDFVNPELSITNDDRLVLITGQAPTSFTKGMRTLLDMARATASAEDFSRRRDLRGYSSKDARTCYETVAKILRAYAEEAASDEALWRFLRVWDFAVLDFQSPSSVAEALVKSVLAAASNGRSGTASETWTALLNLVGERSGRAQSFNWAELPAELRDRYRLPATEREAYAAMAAAASIVRGGVADRLARTVSLPRQDVLADGFSLFNDVDAVLVIGPAGSGKSVIAARLYDVMAGGGLALAVRADTLATPHLAMSAQHLGVGLQSLLRLFALHPRKLLWVESGERFFEKTIPEREAFGDLLRILTLEGGWKLLVTCRDYNVDLFRTVFLEPNGMRSAVLAVPPLTDAELDTATAGLPALSVPMTEPALREILRNPFYLNFAAKMNWSAEAPPAITRRAFRQKAWREVISRDGEGTGGLSIEREKVMVEVALRRARALVPFVSNDNLAPRAVEALIRDSLLAQDPNDPTAKVAPAHDLYEDWALLRWLSRLLEDSGGSLDTAFFGALGTYPALRRSFRLWLLEQLDSDFSEAQGFVFAIMNNPELPAHWRDEALVAVFHSVSAPALLRQLGASLVANAELLRRAVHLLRVSCRSLPSGSAPPALAPETLLPSGLAWDVMPELILMAQQSLDVHDLLLILDFLTDWARGARMQLDAPAAPSVAQLCRLLLLNARHIVKSSQGMYREAVLKVLLAIPRATEQVLRTMVETAITRPAPEDDDHLILKLLWSHFDGATVARDLPELAMRVAEHRLRLGQPTTPASEVRSFPSMEGHDNALFGLAHLSKFDFYPASAWHGPFLNLLTHHPERGLDLLIRFVNGSCLVYSTKWQGYERSVEISLELPDGAVCRQWANQRLWCLFRATNVGPTILSSALMALEAWLLLKGERGDSDLPVVFSQVLRKSNNIAMTAVLVSVALAYPYLVGEAALPLITHPFFFEFENHRVTQDLFGDVSKTIDPSSERDPEKELFWRERQKSARRIHRRFHLETLVVMLQTTSARPHIWALLDDVREALTTSEVEDNDDARQWLLRLHRMDIRKFKVSVGLDDGRLFLQPDEPPPDLVAYRDRDLPAHKDYVQRTGSFLWGRHVFEGEAAETYRPEEWREKLAEVRALQPSNNPDALALLGGQADVHTEAVCLRDHWDELDAEERAWCADRICLHIESLPQRGVHAAGMLALSGGLSPAAQLVSMILARGTDPSMKARAKRGLAVVLLYSDRQFVLSASYGIGAYLFAADRALALNCIGVLIQWARETADFRAAQRAKPRGQREREDEFDERLRERLRSGLEQEILSTEAALFSIDFLRQPGVRLLQPILEIFRHAYTDPLAVRFHVHLADILLAAWQGERNYRWDEKDDRIELHNVEEYQVSRALARFILSCSEDAARSVITALTTAACVYPRELAEFVEHLILMEDHRPRPSGGRFWMLWQVAADATLAQIPSDQDKISSGVARLLRAVFLGISWKSDAHTWPPLTGQGSRILAFFRRLPSSATTLRAFSKIVAQFRGEFVPGALPAIAEHLARLSDRSFLDSTTMRSLEAILGSLVYSGASDIRRKPEQRAATLSLLDMLIEAGSSAAFKIRDDFLTPLRS